MKRIDEIDPNFKINGALPEDTVIYDPREAPFKLYGLVSNAEGSYCRLPLEFIPECNEGVQFLAWHLAGACVRFSTDSDRVSVLWALTDTTNMPHFTAAGQSGLELFEESDDGIRHVKTVIPTMDNGRGCAENQCVTVTLPNGYIPAPDGKMHSYVLYFPLYSGFKAFMLGFAPNARIETGRTPRIEKPIVFYGSSITQGGCASKVGSCYTSLLARRLDAAQINLGFSGSARGEENMARYIASLDMSVFVMDYDHNAPSAEHLAATHEKFFSIIREAQPDLPIVLVSKPDFDSDPVGNSVRRDIIVKTYAHALEKGDKNVYFVDGEHLFGNTNRYVCTVDGCHPTDLGFVRMADTMEPVLHRILYR